MGAHAGIFPAPLRKGDTVAFVSPSFRANAILPDHLDRGQKFFRELGFEVKVIFQDIENLDFESQLQQRCEELHSAFRDRQVKAIICTVGGGDSHELLPLLDYDLIRANPKVFIGFSDITSLHCALFTQANLRTFYGPMAIDPFGDVEQPNPFTTDAFLKVVLGSGEKPLGLVPVSVQCNREVNVFAGLDERAASKTEQNNGWRWLRKGSAKGRILGGCLEPLMNLPGSKYFPNLRDRILLLETSMNEDGSKGVPLDKVRAQMASLRNLGVFDIVRGLVLGRPYGCDREQQEQFDQIFLNQTRGYEFPILADVDIGHTDPIITLPLNSMVRLDSAGNTFDILEHSVEVTGPEA